MAEIFFKWIAEQWPYLAGLILVGFIVAWIVNKCNHWTRRIENNENECKKIESHIEPTLNRIENSLTDLTISFRSLIAYLKGKDGSIDTTVFISKSPIQLSEIGVEILTTSGGKDYVDMNADNLIAEMDKMGTKTALDAQLNAPMAISSRYNTDNFKHIKDYIFSNPFYRKGEDVAIPLNLKIIADIMGVYLRDKYLEKNPHLNPEDIPS